MAFLQNKKQQRILSVATLFIASGVFFLAPFPVHAFLGFDSFGDTVIGAFKVLLYGVFTMFGWFASVAITIFEWAISPEYMSGDSGILNKKSVYEMWKFVRDFFNLFFILTLLYTAFTIVFQVASNYKKTLLSIVLAALFVNFSFPVTRVIIDITNVPMYYFVNQLGSTDQAKQKDFLGSVLSASKLKGILIPGAQDGGTVDFATIGVPQFFMAIVFLFIFSISLMVLAILFVIRLAALVILLIFSSVGFAASVIPGLGKYGSMWWDKLWQYTIFGPAAMLMLVVATRFFAEISQDNTEAQFLKAGIANSNSDTASLITSAAMFSIPIVMLWMTIGLANSFSVMGAGAISGRGQKMAKWLARNNPVSYPVRKFSSGVGQGVKSRFNDSSFGKFLASPSSLETYGKGVGKTVGRENIVDVGRAGMKEVKTEKEKFHTKRVAEEEKRMEEARTSDSQLRSIVATPDKEDKETVEAAVRLLSKRGGFQDSTQLTQALAAIDVANPGNPAAQAEKRAEVIKKADKELFRDANSLVAAISQLGNDTKSIAQLVDKVDAKAFDGMTTAQYQGMVATNPAIKDKLDQKLKKEGYTKVLIDTDIASGTMTRQAAYDKHLGGMSAEDVGKVRGIHGGAGRAPDAELITFIENQTVHSNNWTPKEHTDAFSKLNAEQKTAWTAAGINP